MCRSVTQVWRLDLEPEEWHPDQPAYRILHLVAQASLGLIVVATVQLKGRDRTALIRQNKKGVDPAILSVRPHLFSQRFAQTRKLSDLIERIVWKSKERRKSQRQAGLPQLRT